MLSDIVIQPQALFYLQPAQSEEQPAQTLRFWFTPRFFEVVQENPIPFMDRWMDIDKIQNANQEIANT